MEVAVQRPPSAAKSSVAAHNKQAVLLPTIGMRARRRIGSDCMAGAIYLFFFPSGAPTFIYFLLSLSLFAAKRKKERARAFFRFPLYTVVAVVETRFIGSSRSAGCPSSVAQQPHGKMDGPESVENARRTRIQSVLSIGLLREHNAHFYLPLSRVPRVCSIKRIPSARQMLCVRYEKTLARYTNTAGIVCVCVCICMCDDTLLVSLPLISRIFIFFTRRNLYLLFSVRSRGEHVS